MKVVKVLLRCLIFSWCLNFAVLVSVVTANLKEIRKSVIFTYSLIRFLRHCMRCPFIVNAILYISIQYIKNEELGD